MYGQIYVLGQICTPYMSVLKKTFNLVQFFSPQKQTWTPVSGCECIGFSIQCLNTTRPWIWKASCNLWVTASHSCQALSLSPKVCCKFLQLLFVILFVILNVYISNLLFVIYGSPRATVDRPYLSHPKKVASSCNYQFVFCKLYFCFSICNFAISNL